MDVLSILSNPFDNDFNDKPNFVLRLAREQAKIEDQIQVEHKVSFQLFLRAAHYYGMMKSGTKHSETHRDAKVIGNNFEM